MQLPATLTHSWKGCFKTKRKGFDKNTIIVLWGDHGFHLGDHSMWTKHTNFEQSTRSPLLIRDPRIKKTVRVNSPTEFIDVFPTLCDLAELETPNILDKFKTSDDWRSNHVKNICSKSIPKTWQYYGL